MNLISGSLDSVKQQVKAMASTVSSARPADLRQKLAGMSRADLVAVLGGAVSIYFLWPAAAAPAAAGAMMKAPGAAGIVVSRVAFLAHKQLYFQVLRTAGPAAAVAVLSV
ncbi:hypothetical protein QYE76_039796 [Lolium multiflorum]|uniref:Uncharacterized protein n=1 Tax=Lolium multiflorum TaxID=4521 RepID=A0AAD8WUU6_LOLMU|nr:hypothetical protein QYE76_039796 [Lolium multiflorum]